MDQKQYINERLEQGIKWYDDNSQKNKKYFKILRITEIACAAIIPFVAGISQTGHIGQFIVGILGVVIAICAGVASLNNYQENWLNYRSTCEMLRHEKYLFLTGCKPYDNSNNAFFIFVERIESLISKEQSQWSQGFVDKSQDDKK